jgi:hypothetical protein
MMKNYLNEISARTAAKGLVIDVEKISLSSGYRDGVVVAPLDFEPDEFCGVWFVQFGIAVSRRFAVYRRDLGQARFRFSTVSDVRHPNGISKNEAEVERDKLVEALDQRFGAANVNTAATNTIEEMQIWQRLWPCDGSIDG